MDSPGAQANALLITHAVFGSIAALILVPAGILLARYGRMWSHWATVHRSINVATLVFVVIAFATGESVSSSDPGRPSSNPHPTLGVVTFAVILVQVVIGIYAKWRVPAPSFAYVTLQKDRHWIRFVHLALGVVAAGLLYGQIMTGLQYWNDVVEEKSQMPKGVNIAFWVLLGVEIAVYIAGWPLAELRGRRRRAAEERETLEKTPITHSTS